MTSNDLFFHSDDSCEDIMAVITFNDEHIWCTKKYKDAWFNLDSLSNEPEKIECRRIFARRGFGWIIVWKGQPT